MGSPLGAASTTRKKAKELAPEDLAILVDAVEAAIRREGFVRKAALGKLDVPPSWRGPVLEALARRGLEVDAKGARVPIEEQLAVRLAAQHIPLKKAGTFVPGATPKRVGEAVQALLRSGRAMLIVRATELVLARESATDTLTPEDMARLERTLGGVLKAAALARRKGAALLRADVATVLAGFAESRAARAAREAESSRREALAPAKEADVLAAIERVRNDVGLSFVPDVVRALAPASTAAVHAALVAASRAGRVELHPEGGMGRLSAEDLALCVPGPQDSRLSWTRRIGGAA